MKTQIGIAAAAAAVLSAGAAYAETRDYDFSGFTRISAAKGVIVKAVAGEDFSVSAEGSSENLDQLEIELRKSTLKVGRENRFNGRWKGGAPVVYVSLPSLQGVGVSTGADLEASSISAGSFSVGVSTGGEALLDGVCEDLDASASTGAELDAEGLECKSVDISVSTGAGASVYASERLDASASTGGGVDAYGDPKETDISKSLGGSVSLK